MSDDEAFESAEEGESEKTVIKASSEKRAASGESSKPTSSKGTDKGGGKQKGKQQQQQQQQQQQRKGKTKAQAKPATDKKDKHDQKRAAVEKTKASPNPGSKGSKPEDEKETKTQTEPASGPLESDSSKPVKLSESVKPKAEKSEKVGDAKGDESEKSGDAKGEEPGTEAEKDFDKEAQGKPSSGESVDTEKKTLTDTSSKSSEPAGKSAGEIRQSLSSSTEDAAAKNPVDQSIPRESGDAVGGSGADEDKQEASDSEGRADGAEGWDWGWGSTLLDAATNSLETFSSQVGDGLTTIIDTVESSFGVPDPQQLAQADAAIEPNSKEEKAETVTVQPHEKEGSEEPPADRKDTGAGEKEKEQKEISGGKAKEEKEGKTEEEKEEKAEGQGSSWLSGWGMSSISNMGKSLVNKSQNLMNTGFEKAENLAAGGLDILETIGKKTYTTLTEHDPGLRRAREFLHHGQEKPSLSSVLRDAKDQAEEEVKHHEELEEARKCNFTALFEDNQGLVHLEALEMLSNQSERKVQSLLSAMEEDTLDTIRLQLLDIKDIFQKACDDADDDGQSPEDTEQNFSKLVTENLSELHLGTAPDKLNQVQETVHQWIADFYSHEDHSEISDPKEIHQRAVQSIADITAKAVEQFHKAGELVLLQKDEEKSCSHRATSLAKLCSVLVTEIDVLANKFSHCLNKIGEEKNSTEEVNPMVTSVFLEASNASGYIQDAFQLLLPVLQHAALQTVL